jgi:hypothetical protein
LSSVAGLISRLPGLVSVQDVSATAFAVSVPAVVILLADNAAMRRLRLLFAASGSPVARKTSPTRKPMAIGLPALSKMPSATVVSDVKSAYVFEQTRG